MLIFNDGRLVFEEYFRGHEDKWYEWHAPLSSARNDIVGIWFQDKDPVSFILERLPFKFLENYILPAIDH
jgi:hypothetical protein